MFFLFRSRSQIPLVLTLLVTTLLIAATITLMTYGDLVEVNLRFFIGFTIFLLSFLS